MIFGNINQEETFLYINEIQECLNFARQSDLISMNPGYYEIDGDKLGVNLCEYVTSPREQRFWEAHRRYIDLHLMICGKEIIDFGFISKMKQNTYVYEKDFLPLEGESAGQLILREGDFLVCFPQDAHRTAIQVKESVKIRKAIFKILIQ